MSRRLAVLMTLLALAGCKRKQDVTALSKDDGQGKTHECKLVAGGRIAQDVTIKAGCLVSVDESYVITGNATLKIEPGAKLAFKKGARIVVEDGVISAQGRKTEPIVFTSAEPTPAPGDWGGLVFQAEKPSLLDNVVVEWAGGEPLAAKPAAPPSPKSYAIIGLIGGGRVGSLSPLADRRPAIQIGPSARLALVESTIRHAAKVGVAAEGESPFVRFEHVQFDANGGYAMDVPASAVAGITSLVSAEPVRIRGSVHTNQIWPKLDLVVASLEVVSGEKGGAVVLTLAPETILRIEPKTSLRIGGYGEGGALVAHKVLFTSSAAKPAAGDWAGIHFQKRAPGTVIDECILEFAGYEDPPPPPSPSAKPKPTKVKEPVRPKPSALVIQEWMKDFQITNNTFRNNNGPGMGKADSLLLWGFGTGGCEGLDAPKFGNKSIGQPLCEYHEDPMSGLLGAFDTSLGTTTGIGMLGAEAGSGVGGLGMSGIGAGGGDLAGPGLGGLGHGGGTASGSMGKAGGSVGSGGGAVGMGKGGLGSVSKP